jgi:hypothetical protein
MIAIKMKFTITFVFAFHADVLFLVLGKLCLCTLKHVCYQSVCSLQARLRPCIAASTYRFDSPNHTYRNVEARRMLL